MKNYEFDLADFFSWFESTQRCEARPEYITSIDIREYKSHLQNE
ncbi:MAG TPA: hypothetical protein DCW46_01130 [Desulfotomaculum sp.]|nr:hypothetical protein [Desulfotomaculum sp.]